MMIQPPIQAEEIIEKLNSHGFEAFVVGGCVRDSLLHRKPEDWDITTSARPEQVKAVFGRTIDTGLRHGTVTIMKNRTGYEVTTYRIDGEYEDGRHPKSVEFTASLEEDLKRRDFTINALAYSRKTGLIDLFEGVRDLEERRIRCVGRPEERFGEDALRILRAIRFSAQLGFEIEEGTERAIKKMGPNLVHISKERIQAELTKLLLSDHPDYVKKVFDYGLAPYISQTFPKIDAERIFMSSALPAYKYLRWAELLSFQTREEAQRILKELKMDNDTVSRAGTLVFWRFRPIEASPAGIRRVMSLMPEELFDSLLLLKESGSKRPGQASDADTESEWQTQTKEPESPEELRDIREESRRIRERGDCVSLKTLAVTGKDLLEHGVRPGKMVGETLQRLFALVLEHPEKNQKEELLREIKNSEEK